MNMTWNKMIKLAMSVKPEPACRDAVEWAKSVAGTADATIDAMIVENASWALWGIEFIGLELTDEQFSRAVKAEPWAALEYSHACDRLTNKQFERAVEAKPWMALGYRHVCDRLTDEQFERAVEAEPWMALEYEHVKKRAEAK